MASATRSSVLKRSVLKRVEAGGGLVSDRLHLPAIARPHAAHSVGSLHFADNQEDAANFVSDIDLDISSL